MSHYDSVPMYCTETVHPAAKGIPENDKLFVRFTVRILDGYQGAGAGKKDLIRIFAGFFLHIVDGTHRLILMIGHDTAI